MKREEVELVFLEPAGTAAAQPYDGGAAGLPTLAAEMRDRLIVDERSLYLLGPIDVQGLVTQPSIPDRSLEQR